jgi:hydroxymethylpyrimidine/phosphomethylpyrimidine kinase
VPEYRFAVNCRFDADVEHALEDLDGRVAEYDRDRQPERVQSGDRRTMDWAAERVFAGLETGATAEAPVAAIDRGAHGKEPIVKLLASSPNDLIERVDAVLRAL